MGRGLSGRTIRTGGLLYLSLVGQIPMTRLNNQQVIVYIVLFEVLYTRVNYIGPFYMHIYILPLM